MTTVLIPVQATIVIPVEVDGDLLRDNAEQIKGIKADVVNISEVDNGCEFFEKTVAATLGTEAHANAVDALVAGVQYFKERNPGPCGYISLIAGVLPDKEILCDTACGVVPGSEV